VVTDRLRLPEPPEALAARVRDGGAVAWREPVVMATYEPAAPDRYPMFFANRVYQGSSGRVYPIPFIDRIATESTPRTWDAVHLENRWLRLMVLPELGGRIHVGFDKSAGYDFFYRNNVIKPALVGLAGPWISGGVEFNWPQHHRPATFLPVDIEIEEHADGSVTVWCSDHDPFARMKGMHGVRMHPERATVELVVRLHNRTDDVQTFLWWANVAARVHDDYQSFFPTDVRFVADHARRAITAFPAADRPYYGVDYPARAADGGDRLDFYRNIPVPTSYMVTDTVDDFFGGYDHRVDAGFVHVADRHIAPGKKQWTWGDAPFGHAWDRLLTDDDGPYVELMAGVYTDNQPDFAWLQPGETKSFTQTWYPIQKIGPAHQATTEAAVRLDLADGELRVGVAVSALRPATRLLVTAAGRPVLDERLDLEPGQPFVTRVPARGVAATEVEVTVVQDGAELLRWSPRPAARGTEPWVATEPPRPADTETVEELYLTGVHLAQYRHPTWSPLAYWEEALRRDPDDVRTNLALGDRALRAGEYLIAEEHVRRALRRLVRRNANPRDGEASYLLGRILERTDRPDAAYDAYAKAAWDARWAPAAEVLLARLDARAGRWVRALAHAEAALAVQPLDSRAVAVRVVALRALGRTARADEVLRERLAADPLDRVARALAGHGIPADARTAIDVALDLAASGDVARALEVLAEARSLRPGVGGDARPLARYHRARLLELAGRADEAAAERSTARSGVTDLCFPAGLDDHDALRAALAADPYDDTAAALLAMLLIDAGRGPDALELLDGVVARGSADPVAHRNAAILTHDLRGDRPAALALYDAALALDPSSRLLAERDELLARAGATPLERVALLDEHRSDVLGRDALAVEYCRLLVRAGRELEALAILESRPFAPWEGGEGLAITAWEEVTARLADLAEDRGDLAAAASYATRAIDVPDTLGEKRHPLTDTTALHERLATLLDALGRTAEAASVRAAATVSDSTPVSPTRDDGTTDYFATSLPDLLTFAARPPVPRTP
jgi:tetratricopeptide (TPR) repeat protein